MSMDATVAELGQVFVETYALYLKTQNYHWNVTGANFKSLHEMFEENYKDLADAVDDIAERIKTLDGYPPATFTKLAKLTKVGDALEQINANDMLRDLIKGYEILIKTMKSCMVAAVKDNDEATISLMVARLETSEKNIWMLKSSIG